MKSYEPVAFVYAAAEWCPRCLPVSQRRNGVSVIFAGQQEDYDEGLYCSKCGEEIFENPHHYQIGAALLRVEIKAMDARNDLFPGECCYEVTLRSKMTSEPFLLYTVSKQVDKEYVMNLLWEYAYDGSKDERVYRADELAGDETQEEEKSVLGRFAYFCDVAARLKSFLGDELFVAFVG